MHRLATVHVRDNQPTNDQRRHDTAYLNKCLFYYSKVRRLKIVRFWWNSVHYSKRWTRLQSSDQKMKFLKIPDGGRRHLENRFLGHN